MEYNDHSTGFHTSPRQHTLFKYYKFQINVDNSKLTLIDKVVPVCDNSREERSEVISPC